MSDPCHSVLSCNVRFLLWREGIRRERWAESLRSRLGPGWTLHDVAEILRGKPVTPRQIEDLARVFEMTEEELAMGDLVSERGTNVLSENLRYLAGTLGHGGKKELAEYLAVDPSTISRWLAEDAAIRPKRSHLRELTAHFGLTGTTDLTRDPVFLSLDPVSTQAKKQWLKARIDAMPAEEIHDLFSALRRLLEER